MRIAQALVFACSAVIPVGAAWAGAEMAFDSAPVSDAELAGSYGKFIAPGGIDLAMSVQQETAIDGHLVLRSVFTVDQGPATLTVYAPAANTQGPTTVTTSTTGHAQSAPAGQSVGVSFDRSSGGATVTTSGGTPQGLPNVTAGSGQTSISISGGDGLVPVIPSTAGVETGGGTVSVAATTNVTRVTLDAAGLSVSHLFGSATGAIVANTANNRAIDTVTSISIDVRNSDMLSLGSSLVRVGNIATYAAQGMIR